MASAIIPGISAVGNMVGGKGAAKAQQSAQDQANQENQQAMQMITNFQKMAAPVVSSLVSSLANWSGLKPQEMSALTTNAAASGMSDIATAQSRGAYGANQNATILEALRSNQQGAEGAAVNVGAQAAQQELSALQSIPSALNVLNPVSGGANTAAGMGQASGQTAAGYGNPYAPAITSIGQLLAGSSGNQPVAQATPAPVTTGMGGSMDYQGTSPAPGQAGSW